jgi:hypothetical protein
VEDGVPCGERGDCTGESICSAMDKRDKIKAEGLEIQVGFGFDKCKSPDVETSGLLVKALISSYFKNCPMLSFQHEQTPLML